MYNDAIKDISLKNPSTGNYDTRNIGAEAEDVVISRDSSGNIIEDLSEPGVVVASTESLAETAKNLEDNAVPKNHASASAEYGGASASQFGHVKIGSGITVSNNGVISATFDGLSDTNFTNPQTGQIPKYNATSGKWENGTGGGHVVKNQEGSSVTQRDNLLFKDSDIVDDTDTTTVEVIKPITKATLNSYIDDITTGKDGFYNTTDEGEFAGLPTITQVTLQELEDLGPNTDGFYETTDEGPIDIATPADEISYDPAHNISTVKAGLDGHRDSFAPVEVSPTEGPHTEGSCIMYNGKLYEVIATGGITVGTTLNAGTGGNIKLKTISEINSNLADVFANTIVCDIMQKLTNTWIFNIPNAYRGMLIVCDSATSYQGLYIVAATSVGELQISTVLAADSITLVTNVANELTLNYAQPTGTTICFVDFIKTKRVTVKTT